MSIIFGNGTLAAPYHLASITTVAIITSLEYLPMFRILMLCCVCLAWSGAAEPIIPSVTGTGRYQVQRIDGKWWFFDREGKATFITGINGGIDFNMANGPDGRNRYREAVAKRFPADKGGGDAWWKWQQDRLHTWGFNFVGGHYAPNDNMLNGMLAWHLNVYFNGGKRDNGTPYQHTEMLYPGVSWHGVRNVFSADYPHHMAKEAEYLTRFKDHPGYFGAYIDNERNFDGLTEVPLGCWRLPADNPAKQALLQAAKQVFGDNLVAFNVAWKRDYATWDAVAADTDAPLEARDPKAQKMCEVLLEMAADRFFGVLVTEIKKRAPDTLIIGCRQHQHDMPEVFWKVMGKWCDIVSLNHYLPSDEKGIPAPAIEPWDRIAKLTGRPLLISEWGVSTKTVSYSGSYRSQAERADGYRKIAETMAANPNIIGFQYFKLQDDEPGTEESYAWGLVDVNDEPYPEMVAMTAKVNPTLLRVHAEGTQRHLYKPELPISTRWTAIAPTTPTADASTPLANGALTLVKQGDRFRAFHGGVDLKCGFAPVINLRVPSDRGIWPGHLTIDSDHEDAAFRVLTCTWSWQPARDSTQQQLPNQIDGEWRGDALDTKPHTAFGTTWRMWIPKDGKAWMATEAVSVTNHGSYPWQLTFLTHRWNPLVAAGFRLLPSQRGIARDDYSVGLRYITMVSPRIGHWGGALWLDGGGSLHADIGLDLGRLRNKVILEPGETHQLSQAPLVHAFYTPTGAGDTDVALWKQRDHEIEQALLTHCERSRTGKLVLDLNDAAKGR